jgi:hypothetical protein
MRAMIFFTLAASSAVAHADPWSFGIEPRVGAMIPTSKLGANVTGGVEFDVATPVADHRLTIGLDASFARPSYSSSAMSMQLPSTLDYSVQQLEVLVGLTANYRFLDATHQLVPRVGAGPVLHMLRTTEDTMPAYAGSNQSQQTKPGFEATFGVDYAAGPGFLAGDLRFIYSSLDTPLTGSSNAGSLSIAVGYRLVF